MCIAAHSPTLVVRGEAGVGKPALLEYAVGLEAERSGAGAPSAAGRLSSGFAGLDVVAGRVFGWAAVDLLPDVVEVVALGQGRDDGHRLIPPGPKWQGCPCSSHDAWV